MTTQRDRLAAVLLEAAAGREDPPLMEMTDALLARGVRVVDAQTLAAAMDRHLGQRYGWWGVPNDAAAILALLDGEADR